MTQVNIIVDNSELLKGLLTTEGRDQKAADSISTGRARLKPPKVFIFGGFYYFLVMPGRISCR
jgi:hypothetical protein